MTPAKKKRAVAKPAFTVSLMLGDQTYQGQADTILEALEKITPKTVKTRALITVDNGKKRHTEVYFVVRLKRLFANRIARELFQKRMLTTLHA